MTISFTELSLCEPLLRALTEENYQQPTPIQEAAIPKLLAGKDLQATAQTGTGKTAAFALPMLQMLSERRAAAPGLRALILTPTRELALQIGESLRNYGRHIPLRTTVILGGVPFSSQVRALQSKPDILVATPGRLIDLMQQRVVRLDAIEMFVLDEADRMLDMGFLPDVRRIIAALPAKKQTMLFSATMSPEISQLAAGLLHAPVRVQVAASASIPDTIEQRVIFVNNSDKRALLADMLRDKSVSRALVFTRTKHRANRIVEQLSTIGIAAAAIHSNKSQNARQKALASFSAGKTTVLVATDIMARGIDVEGISHVINFELPNEAENYVHRIGRTARAGAGGIAVSLCDAEELAYLADIEKLTKNSLSVIEDHAYPSATIADLRRRRITPKPPPRGGGGGGGGRSRGNSGAGGRRSGGRMN